ncbi:MAG: hypothetical protein EA370_10065 [Wenzhouxiangella sp.]|nr:MAG: hypothetical protein EA370_10065 [Wenzhouxiangella sp.]
MSTNQNPFQPPEAAIEPVIENQPGSDLLDQPRRCPAGNGTKWIAEGWRLFKVRFGLWIAMLIVMGAIFMGLGFIPIIGFLAGAAYPLFFGGWMIASDRVQQEGELRFEDLFAGFSLHFKPLAIAGLLYLAGTLVIMIIAGLAALVMGGSMMMMFTGDPGTSLGMAFAVAFLVYMALFVPVLMAIWFAPALIVFHAIEPIESMKLSFKACLLNIPAFLVYGLVGMFLLILGMIPLLLGWLVVYPVLMIATYAGYRDIFLGEDPD